RHQRLGPAGDQGDDLRGRRALHRREHPRRRVVRGRRSESEGILMRVLLLQVMRRLRRDKPALVAFAVIVLYVAAGLLSLAGVLASGYATQTGEAYAPPSWAHPFGFDVLGRSVWDRLVQGSRVALIVGFFSTAIAIP